MKSKKLFKNHARWINTSSYINIVGMGSSVVGLSIKGYLPAQNGSRLQLVLDNSNSDKIMKLRHKYEDLKTEYEALVLELENALFNLRTYAKVQQYLPEAVPFLPTTQTMALAINFTDIRKKLTAA